MFGIIICIDGNRAIDRANFRHRGTLESWHTAIAIKAHNNAKHLPEQYRFLLQQLLSDISVVDIDVT